MTVIVTVAVVVFAPALPWFVAVTVYWLAVNSDCGVPLIAPVLALMARPLASAGLMEYVTGELLLTVGAAEEQALAIVQTKEDGE